VRVAVVLDQTELGLGEAEQQRVGRAGAQRDGLQAHDVAEQRVLRETFELGLGRLARSVRGHQPVHPQNVHAGHHQAFFHSVEEVTVNGVLHGGRHPGLFAQREHNNISTRPRGPRSVRSRSRLVTRTAGSRGTHASSAARTFVRPTTGSLVHERVPVENDFGKIECESRRACRAEIDNKTETTETDYTRHAGTEYSAYSSED